MPSSLGGAAVRCAVLALLLTACSPGDPNAEPTEALRTPQEQWRALEDAEWDVLFDEQEVGQPWRTDVATDDEQLTVLWQAVAAGTELPTVEWDHVVVVHFAAVWSAGCPLSFEGVGVEASAVFGVWAEPEDAECGDDARPHQVFVAVEREVLPAPPFTVRIGREVDPRAYVVEVLADLRPKGAVLGQDDYRRLGAQPSFGN